MTTLPRQWLLATTIAAILAGCGGDDNSDGSVTSASPEGSGAGSDIGRDGSPGNPDIPDVGQRISAFQFESDQRSFDRDGMPGLNPILSSAPPTCQPTEELLTSVDVEVPAPTEDNPEAVEIRTERQFSGKDYSIYPPCDDVRLSTYNRDEETGALLHDTWIDATVFVPDHREGEKLPVILHSHGWGGTKNNSLVIPEDCALEGAGYDCDLPGSAEEGLFGFFGSVDALLGEFRNNGYIVVSFTERGWGESEGEAMVMNPYHETQDAIAVLDWVADMGQQGLIPVDVADDGDMPVGLIGGSYGGGFQFPLANLDSRVDALVATGTWHSLNQSIVPNDTVKAGYGSLLCVLGATARQHPYLADACSRMSPLAGTLAGLLGGGADAISGLLPVTAPLIQQGLRDEGGLAGLASGIIGPLLGTAPAPIRFDDQLSTNDGATLDFLAQNGLNYFQSLEEQGLGFRDDDMAFAQRPLDVLLIQGMTDTLFPMQEAVNNYRYLNDKGGDVRLLSNQGGHMNLIHGQQEGTLNCGSTDVFAAARTWFDAKIKGASASLSSIPEVCISLDDNTAVAMDGVPGTEQGSVGELYSGEEKDFRLQIEVRELDPVNVTEDRSGLCADGTEPNSGWFGSKNCNGKGGWPVTESPNPQFVAQAIETCEVLHTAQDGEVLAGVPQLSGLTVSGNPGVNAQQQAQLGICVIRDGETLLVDQQLNGFASTDWDGSQDSIDMIAVGEKLQAGDQVGLYATASSEYFNFGSSLNLDELSLLLAGLLDEIPVPVTRQAGEVVTDGDGNPVLLHAVGDPVLDDQGQPQLDTNGNPIVYSENIPETYAGGEPVLDANGEPVTEGLSLGSLLGQVLTPELLYSFIGDLSAIEGLVSIPNIIGNIAGYDNERLLSLLLADGLGAYTETPEASYTVEGRIQLPIFNGNNWLSIAPTGATTQPAGERSMTSELLGR